MHSLSCATHVPQCYAYCGFTYGNSKNFAQFTFQLIQINIPGLLRTSLSSTICALWISHHHSGRVRLHTSLLCALTGAVVSLSIMEIACGWDVAKLSAILDPDCKDSAFRQIDNCSAQITSTCLCPSQKIQILVLPEDNFHTCAVIDIHSTLLCHLFHFSISIIPRPRDDKLFYKLPSVYMGSSLGNHV